MAAFPVMAAATAAALASLGTPFPHAVTTRAPEPSSTVDAISHVRECFVGYRLRTDAGIGTVARYYRDQGVAAGATLIADTVGALPGFALVTFAKPKFLSVVLARADGATTVDVSYAVPCGT